MHSQQCYFGHEAGSTHLTLSGRKSKLALGI